MPKNVSDYSVESDEDFDVNDRPQSQQYSPVSLTWESSRPSTATRPTDFKFDSDIQIIRFRSDLPMSYSEHWLDGKTSGKKSYNCLNPRKDPSGPSCPLCQMDSEISGQYAKPKWAFTIVNFSVDPFERQLMTGTKRLIDALNAMDTKPNVGPLFGKYWAISKSGERQTLAYHVTPVKERDLKEDWGINPTEAKKFFESVEPFSPSILKFYSVQELQQIADDLS